MTGRRRATGTAAAAVAVALLASACTSGAASPAPTSTAAAPTSAAATPAAPTSATPTSAAPTSAAPEADPAPALPPVTDPVSLPALMREDVRGSNLKLGRVLARTDAYTRYAVTYRADDLRISGVMNVPDGEGPFPVVVLLHGYIDPDVYVTGQGYRREQDSLARNGYVAFHVDYRNHAGSDDDPRNDVDLRLGYARDAIAAVKAVKASALPFLDGERVGMIGRSMGGGVAFNTLVAAPGLVDAAVTYASVSTDAVDNYERWIRFDDGRSELAARIEAEHGSPEDAPEFWRGISARNYFDRIETPVMVHHGVVDDTCPIRWSRATVKALRAADVDLTYHEYDGEGHYFYGGWARSFQRTLAFLDEHLTA
ncbi:MAG: prolyl oligopeptidase family serine peptidase [Candidatus Nanopelagicales bacterium]